MGERGEPTVEVDTARGRLRGRRAEDCCSFRAVPYAEPPVGAARFRPPEPFEPWAGTRDALEFGAIAPQLPSVLDHYFGTSASAASEDCLTLNVWTSACDDQRRPVLVWIHGGAFVTGTAATPWYSGRRFARSGCVLVSINYRLGALGFTHLADLAGERFAASGNLGVLDQVAALAWVRENIAALGGDPGNVTVFGESAGGASIVALLATPSARGLFARAVVQSASFTQLRTRERATDAATELLGELGLAPEQAGEIVDMPAERLLAAQRTLLGRGAAAFTAFAPTPDGTVLEPAPAATHPPDVPVLIGTTRDEMHLFTFADPAYTGLDDAALIERAAVLFGDRAPAVVAAYRAARPGASPGQLASAIATDQAFRVPARRYALGAAAVGAPVWSYLFTQTTPVFGGGLGACHGLEIPYVFDNLHQRGVALFTGEGSERAEVAAAMHGDWVRFASAGDPGWAPWTSTRRPVRVYGPDAGVADDPEADLLAHWEGVA